LVNKLSWQLGWAGEKCYASGVFFGCGLVGGRFEQPAGSGTVAAL